MNIFYDVDDTLITWNWKLRPGVRDVFERLRADGHTIYLWSGLGPRWEFVERFDMGAHIADCFSKPLYRHHERLAELAVPLIPDYVVDDYVEIVDAFGGTHVAAATAPFTDDREMWRVYDEFTAFAAGKPTSA